MPEEVLVNVKESIQRAPNTNQSILGISHRSEWFKEVVKETENNLRVLLNIPKNYHILQLQGGSTLQFSMIPILLLRGKKKTAEYLKTGYWSTKSIPDAMREGKVKVLYDGENTHFSKLPLPSELSYDPEAAYFHYVSNETVEGLQFHYLPGLKDGVPRVCDMSSDFLSRPFEVQNFAIVYAHAQKNLGPAGLTAVLLRDDLIHDAPDNIPSMLNYKNHIDMGSIYNTPPVFAMYVTMLVTRWLLNTVGGLEKMAQINERKAQKLYQILDLHPGFFQSHGEKKDRSIMNVSFRLPSIGLERKFIGEAEQAGFYGLEGHRSLGGLRASLYNAVTENDVDQLVDFMTGFYNKNKQFTIGTQNVSNSLQL